MPVITSVNGAKKEINRIIHSVGGTKKDIGKMYLGAKGGKTLVFDSRKYDKAEWNIINRSSGIEISANSSKYGILPELGWNYTHNVKDCIIEFKLENTKVKKGDKLTYEYYHNFGTRTGNLYIDFYDGKVKDGLRLYNKKVEMLTNKEGLGIETLIIESAINSYLNLVIQLSVGQFGGGSGVYKVYNVYLNGHRIG